MNILLVGAGTETSKLNVVLSEQKHTIQAQLAMFSINHLDLFDFKLMIVVSPEASVGIDTLVRAVERGKIIFLVAGATDGLAAWAAGTGGVPTFSYPLSGVELDRLLGEVRRADSGGISGDDNYRKIVLGGDIAARIQGQMNARKIVITSPKGGTGKTTVSVNLAVALALSGVTTYLVDADANAGALQYHLRLTELNNTLIGLLRRMSDSPPRQSNDAMSAVASAGIYLAAFTPINGLPTLRVLPGMVTDDLGDKALQREDVIDSTIKGLFEAGVASGGVVIMDVGINPSHPVHRAALRYAEAIAIVIKPEIPDLAETRRWIARMIASLSGTVGKMSAMEFVGSRVKLCYNMVVGDEFKNAHKSLQNAINEDGIAISLAPNGILPVVDARMAAHAVNSNNVEDILVWRYKLERLEELAPFVEALVAFASHFVPAVREGAARIGLVRGQQPKKKGLLGRR
jgi:MinD-like ATPase involved in chromosome partitioning or flagellar assembly